MDVTTNETTSAPIGRRPEPGVYHDVDFGDYLAIEAASSTALRWLRKSPAHMKAYRDDPPQFEASRIGKAVHALLLDPIDEFSTRFAKGPTNDRRLAKWKAFERDLAKIDESERPIALTINEWSIAHAMAFNVRTHPAAGGILDDVEMAEVTLVWRDDETGLLCKARCDGLNLALGAIVDLKTTKDASDHGFRRSIATYSYHIQSAFYLRGARATLDHVGWQHYAILAVEKERPFAARAFRIHDDAIALGDDEVENLLRLWRDCDERGVWPAYSTRFTEIDAPSWAYSDAFYYEPDETDEPVTTEDE